MAIIGGTDVGLTERVKLSTKRPDRGPVFVVGSMRSGSTLLRLILDSHPNIAIGAETGFMGALLATKTIPDWLHGSEWYKRINWSTEEMDDRLRDFYAGMFERYAAAQGKQRWGEKTPFHTTHIVRMAEIFPDAVFIGIVRHPGAVASSLRSNFHYTFSDALSYWEATNLTMLHAAGGLGCRFVTCRYEDLVTQGEPVLQELVEWLGEPWSATLLEHHKVLRKRGVPRAADGGTSSREPINRDKVSRWIASTTEGDRRALQSCGALAAFFGYELADPTRRGPLVSSGRWLATGEDLKLRQEEWANRVDFSPDVTSESFAIDADPKQLAERLSHTERRLARVLSRKSVRLGNAFRKVQRGRSWKDVREAFMLVWGNAPNSIDRDDGSSL